MPEVLVKKLENGKARCWFWVCEEDGWCGAEFTEHMAQEKANHHQRMEHTHHEVSDHGLLDV